MIHLVKYYSFNVFYVKLSGKLNFVLKISRIIWDKLVLKIQKEIFGFRKGENINSYQNKYIELNYI